ncbi:zf-HC2 domain-containing protein [Brevibacillus dissolubilis]|uniref:zf-HC2 domain-containing protein n=1 Tax=Brevibacillus dissolubilis TaxID=1844116 RepID=UPI0011163B03|nr:zf-HC2 domain-containing protein [Brevibacillus dissolubilis]
MRCEEAQELLPDYADNCLPELTRRRMDNHLTGCAACRSEYDFIVDSSDWIESDKQQYSAVAASTSIVDAVMARILSEEKWAIPIGRKVFTLTAKMRRIGLSAAMILLMICSFTLYSNTDQQQDGFMPYSAKAESIISDNLKANVGVAEEAVQEPEAIDSTVAVVGSDQQTEVTDASNMSLLAQADSSASMLAEITSDNQVDHTKPNFPLVLSFFGILITVLTMSWITRA